VVADLAVARRLAASRNVGVVHEDRTTAHVLLRDDAPVSAVLRAVAVVAHHEIEVRRDEQRTPIVMRGLRGRRTKARSAHLYGVLPLEVVEDGVDDGGLA